MGHLLPLSSASHAADRGAVEFGELAPSYPPDRDPSGRSRCPARDTLTVDPRLHGRAVDADRLEVLHDQIGERALTQIRRVEPPQFADTHFPAVVDGDPRPVVEDAQTSGHTPNWPATAQCVTVFAIGDSFDDAPRSENRCTARWNHPQMPSELPDVKSGIRE